jgi:RNA polymerase sigma-70 factor (ECF subfamily)
MTDWQAIISQHSPIAWRTAYRLLGNDADAADCLQETFLSALDVSRREPVRDWSALLRRLATTKAVDRLRQRFRHAKRHEDLSDWTGVPCANPGPTQAAEDAELTAGLRRALASIPAQQATVFCLRCLDELSY